MKAITQLGFICIILCHLIVLGNLTHAQEASEYPDRKEGIYLKYSDAKDLILYFNDITKSEVLDIKKSLYKFPERIVDVFFDDRFNTLNIIYANGLGVKEIYDVINSINPHFLRLNSKPTDAETLDSFVQENNIEKRL